MILAKQRVREDAATVYVEPSIASDRIQAAAGTAERHDALYFHVADSPELFGELRGGDRSRWFRRLSPEWREAIAAVPLLAGDASDLVLSEQMARREIERETQDEARRMQIGVAMPSSDLATALALGLQAGELVAERPDLLEEMRRLGLALHQRLNAKDRADLRQGDIVALAERHRIVQAQAEGLHAVTRDLAALSPAAENLVVERQLAQVSKLYT